ncbi:MAG TPA: hypothetical protein DHN33_11850 [Eubacteriaceae bacterium]|nr:hypothetical protein [Eubacteriaceae bacterium]
MDEKTKALQEERKSLYRDFYNNRIPKRLFVSILLTSHIVAEYGGLNVLDYQYDYSQLREPAKKVCRDIYSDTSPAMPVNLILTRPPAIYQLRDSQSFKMGADGFVQHPEVVGMEENEYGELIEDPYAFLLEKVLPRQYHEMDLNNPVRMLNRMQLGKMALEKDLTDSLGWYQEVMDEHGYYQGSPAGSSGLCVAPYDFIADQLRSFSGVSKDIRRHRSELKEACEAVLPMMYKMGVPAKAHPEGAVFTPLHMPTFMREKDFEEVWFPSYKTLLEQYAANDIRVRAFCEDNWMRYLDHLQELPAGTILQFEYGDPKAIKEKLGKKFIIQGLYPVSLLKSGSKQQVLDKVKELLDVMMPGGGYVFGFDKNPLTLGEINMENLKALAEFVRDYGVYDNPGESFGTPLNTENFTFDEKRMTLQSKYLFDWEEYKEKYPQTPEYARKNFEDLDHKMFNHYLLMAT